jgi:hypothetical protein
MTKPDATLSARESVWAYRIRQKIALERIILTVGTPKEKYRAKQFLEAMEQAYPELLEDFEQYDLELLEHPAPELFDESEYSGFKGRKLALKLPKDAVREEKIVSRAVRDYADLFHPCENTFHNAMTGLRYLSTLHPELFARAREQAVEQRDRILTCEIYCKCGCTTPDNCQPAESFEIASRGRFANVAQRIRFSVQSPDSTGDNSHEDWQFFLDRVRDIAPEMLTCHGPL